MLCWPDWPSPSHTSTSASAQTIGKKLEAQDLPCEKIVYEQGTSAATPEPFDRPIVFHGKVFSEGKSTVICSVRPSGTKDYGAVFVQERFMLSGTPAIIEHSYNRMKLLLEDGENDDGSPKRFTRVTCYRSGSKHMCDGTPTAATTFQLRATFDSRKLVDVAFSTQILRAGDGKDIFAQADWMRDMAMAWDGGNFRLVRWPSGYNLNTYKAHFQASVQDSDKLLNKAVTSAQPFPIEIHFMKGVGEGAKVQALKVQSTQIKTIWEFMSSFMRAIK